MARHDCAHGPAGCPPRACLQTSKCFQARAAQLGCFGLRACRHARAELADRLLTVEEGEPQFVEKLAGVLRQVRLEYPNLAGVHVFVSRRLNHTLGRRESWPACCGRRGRLLWLCAAVRPRSAACRCSASAACGGEPRAPPACMQAGVRLPSVQVEYRNLTVVSYKTLRAADRWQARCATLCGLAVRAAISP